MAPVYKFALIQLQPKPNDPAANFAKAESEIRKAAANGCHVAILPEFHLTGWDPENPDFITASNDSQAYLPRYQSLARELDISIVPGTICESHPAATAEHAPPRARDQAHMHETSLDGKELRNMAHFISAGTGAVAGSYQKKNLWHPERPHLAPGRHQPHSAFDTPLRNADGSPVRAGLLVCWDLAFPEAFRALIADGAQVIFIPSYWTVTDVDEAGLALNPDSERTFLESCVVSRAFENTACVVFCNKGGCSQVALPIVGRVKNEGGGEVGLDEEGVIYSEVDLDVLRVAEENYKVREDIKGRGWHYGYEIVRDQA